MNKAILSISLLILCSNMVRAEVNVASLHDLQSMRAAAALAQPSEGNEEARLAAMRDAAISLGAQSGFKNWIEKLSARLDVVKNELDVLYDFSTVMQLASVGGRNGLYVLPPAIREVNDMYTVNDGVLRISDKYYEITSKAELVSAPPHWSMYLKDKNTPEIVIPHRALWPRTDAESKLWSVWIEEGWKTGIDQAEAEMSARNTQLQVRFSGMVRYMTLVERGVVTTPTISKAIRDTVGGGDAMYVGDTVIRVTEQAKLNGNVVDYSAEITDTRESLRQDREFTETPTKIIYSDKGN